MDCELRTHMYLPVYLVQGILAKSRLPERKREVRSYCTA